MLDERKKWTAEKDMKIISIFPKVKGMTKEARDLMGGDEAKEGLLASAVVVESKLSKIIANVFFSFNLQRTKNDPPIRLFNTKEEAMLWLLDQ